MGGEYRKGYVYVQGVFAGILSETEDGYEFKYDDKYVQADKPLSVSLTLPVTDRIYRSNILFPFFDGLIPEGWILDVISRNWKIDSNDRFGLLLTVCRDCIGDVCIQGEQL